MLHHRGTENTEVMERQSSACTTVEPKGPPSAIPDVRKNFPVLIALLCFRMPRTEAFSVPSVPLW